MKLHCTPVIIPFAAKIAIATLIALGMATTKESKAEMIIKDTKIFAPARLGKVSVKHRAKEFLVNGKEVQNHRLDKPLRNLTTKQLKKAVKGGYLSINRSTNGEYSIGLQKRLNGGGALGASIGFWIGKGTVMLVGHGAIAFASGLTGPFCKGTFVALEGMFGGAIQGTSNIAGLGCGIIGATITGPA